MTVGFEAIAAAGCKAGLTMASAADDEVVVEVEDVATRAGAESEKPSYEEDADIGHEDGAE